jgi:ElaB/YqjD/DUF883 family membrane-anchored ribosome-binding protein
MTKTPEGAAGDLGADLAALRQDVAHLAETMSQLVQHQTKAVGSRASSAFGDVRDRIASTAADARSRARAVGGDLEASFERHPLAALLIAFGVGIALGMMRRGHR